MEKDIITKSYNKLLALRENIPQEKYIHRRYVDEYNKFLGELSEEIKISMDEFMVDESQLQHISGINIPESGWKSVGDKYCERAFLLSKLDSVLLQFRPEENKTPMGFRSL